MSILRMNAGGRAATLELSRDDDQDVYTRRITYLTGRLPCRGRPNPSRYLLMSAVVLAEILLLKILEIDAVIRPLKGNGFLATWEHLFRRVRPSSPTRTQANPVLPAPSGSLLGSPPLVPCGRAESATDSPDRAGPLPPIPAAWQQNPPALQGEAENGRPRLVRE